MKQLGWLLLGLLLGALLTDVLGKSDGYVLYAFDYLNARIQEQVESNRAYQKKLRENAWAEGYNMGLLGQPQSDNPYAKHVFGHHSWHNGWVEGATERLKLNVDKK